MSGTYIVYLDGEEIARTDSHIWVRLAEPGIYLTCGEEEGEGVFVGGEITTSAGARLFPVRRR